MKINKIIVKLIIFVLIQAFLVLDFLPCWPASPNRGEQVGAWCGRDRFLENSQDAHFSTLSPGLNISLGQFQKAFYVLHQRDMDTFVKFIDAKKDIESGTDFKSKNKFVLWLYQKLSDSKKFNELVKILGFVIKGEYAVIKIIIAAIMIGVNISMDIPLINVTLKPAVVAWGAHTENWYIIIASLAFAQFILGGLIRLIPLIVFRIIFYKFVRLNLLGLLINFIPIVGNFAPLMFLEGSQPKDLWFVNEVRKLNRLAKDSITKHADICEDEKKIAGQCAVEIAVAIGDCQSCFCEYDFNCRRFKVRGTTGYSYGRLMRNITREDIQDAIPFYFRAHRWIFNKFGIISPGYGKGTRPILLFDSYERLKEIEEYLNGHLSAEYRGRVYEFDIKELVNTIQRQKDEDNPLAVEAVAKKCIKPMFDKRTAAKVKVLKESLFLNEVMEQAI